jgi:phage tail sheath protein FI
MRQRQELDSQKGFAAMYYPWISIANPFTNNTVTLPPSGAIAGIYARTAAERGVHKAPASEAICGATGLCRAVTQAEQERLNPEGINAIRSFPGRGIMVWGARTISSDPLWKYVNIRMLFNYIEESVDRGTGWATFEPCDEKLWARLVQSVSEFLTRTWKDGALMGDRPEKAFFVRCDRSTMTQNDIDSGRLVLSIGLAPSKPAEFVVFRIARQVDRGAK